MFILKLCSLGATVLFSTAAMAQTTATSTASQAVVQDIVNSSAKAKTDEREKGADIAYSINVGLPKLARGKVSLLGTGSFSYGAKTFGLEIHGHYKNREFGTTEDTVLIDTQTRRISGGGHYVLSATDMIWKLHLNLEYESLSDEYDLFADDGTAQYTLSISDYYSLQSAISAETKLGKLRVEIALGAGYALVFSSDEEDSLDEFGEEETFYSDSKGHSIALLGYAELEYPIWAEILSTRLELYGRHSTVTKTDYEEDSLLGNMIGGGSETQGQFLAVELISRLHFDADILSFGGLKPSFFLGADYFSGLGSQAAFIPMIGVGIVDSE